METRHIKINYEEALSAKKQLLSSELNLLHLVKKIKAYKILRRKELITKNNLKTSLSSLKSKINLIESTFPQEESKITIHKNKKEEKSSSNIQSELEDIKSKLAELGK